MVVQHWEYTRLHSTVHFKMCFRPGWCTQALKGHGLDSLSRACTRGQGSCGKQPGNVSLTHHFLSLPIPTSLAVSEKQWKKTPSGEGGKCIFKLYYLNFLKDIKNCPFVLIFIFSRNYIPNPWQSSLHRDLA